MIDSMKFNVFAPPPKKNQCIFVWGATFDTKRDTTIILIIII